MSITTSPVSNQFKFCASCKLDEQSAHSDLCLRCRIGDAPLAPEIILRNAKQTLALAKKINHPVALWFYQEQVNRAETAIAQQAKPQTGLFD